MASGGTIAIPASTVSAAEFELPTAVKQASEAYRAGDVEKAVSLYPAIEPMRSFAALPNCNVTEEFLNFADAYRQTHKYAEAEALLRSFNLGENELQTAALRATLIRAFIRCDKNEIAKAEALMKDFPRTNPEDLNFPLDRIVRTRIFLAQGKFHEAALEAGVAVRCHAHRGAGLSGIPLPRRRMLRKDGRSPAKAESRPQSNRKRKDHGRNPRLLWRQQLGAAAIGTSFLQQLLGEKRTGERRGTAGCGGRA